MGCQPLPALSHNARLHLTTDAEVNSALALETFDLPDKIVLDLVRYINEGIFEERPWSGFLAALRQLADSGYANIIFRRPGSADEGLTEWA